MRTVLALASLTVLLTAGIGCGDTTTATGADMSMVVGPDMSATPHDMMTLTCAQILSCEQSCTSASCQIGCISEGTTAAKGTFGMFLGCLVQTCGPTDGGGTGMCTGVTDMSSGCQGCLQSTAAGAATGGACHTQFAACASS